MVRHALVQLKPVKGDVLATIDRIAAMLADLQDEQVDIVTFPETALSGYFLQGGVREQALSAAEVFEALRGALNDAGWHRPVDLCLGAFERAQDDLFNSAFYLEFNTENEGVRHVHRKMFLPTYGVFDEGRFVSPGNELEAFDTRFGRAGMLVCEDAWHSSTAAVLALKGADILYTPTATPARDLRGKVPANARRWHSTAEGIGAEHGLFVVTTSLVGFEGGKGFSGYSSIVDPFGETIALGSLLEEEVLLADIHLESIAVARYETPLLSDLRANLGNLITGFQQAQGAQGAKVRP